MRNRAFCLTERITAVVVRFKYVKSPEIPRKFELIAGQGHRSWYWRLHISHE